MEIVLTILAFIYVTFAFFWASNLIANSFFIAAFDRDMKAAWIQKGIAIVIFASAAILLLLL